MRLIEAKKGNACEVLAQVSSFKKSLATQLDNFEPISFLNVEFIAQYLTSDTYNMLQQFRHHIGCRPERYIFGLNTFPKNVQLMPKHWSDSWFLSCESLAEILAPLENSGGSHQRLTAHTPMQFSADDYKNLYTKGSKSPTT